MMERYVARSVLKAAAVDATMSTKKKNGSTHFAGVSLGIRGTEAGVATVMLGTRRISVEIGS